MTNNVNTYSGLVTAIQQWVNRNDDVFISNIPLFISLAEQRVFIDCPTLGTMVYLTGNLNANSGILNKPALWGQTLTLSYIDTENNIHVLERVPYEFIRTWIPNYNTAPTTLLPRYYTDYGYDYFLISPRPTAAYTYELAYFQKAQPLSISNQTNFITQSQYDLLFDAALAEAYRFIDNTVDAQTYDQRYQDRVQAYSQYNQGHLTDRTVDSTKD